jgi:hypothetical protein
MKIFLFNTNLNHDFFFSIMKLRSFFLSSIALLSMTFAPQAAIADGGVYRLTDLSAEQFASNPSQSGWQFEKFTYATGRYSLFTQYSDSCAANYVDIYQPCRSGGERVVQIDGIMEWSANNTFASELRWGWSDYGVYNDGGTTNNSKERFCYIARDEVLGYEVYANDEYASVISFIVPEDGFYQMDATMIRQDVPAGLGLLSVVPRYRYSSDVDKNYVNPSVMLCRLMFGQPGGEIEDYDGNSHISKGASQRYIAQLPENVTMAWEAKKGDIISFEVNTDSTGVHSDWARDFYGRAFYRQLNITLVDESTAKANSHFADTYGDSEALSTLSQLISEYEDFVMDVDYGDRVGQYSGDIANQLLELIGTIYDALQNGQIHAFNASSYLEQLQTLWQQFLDSRVDVDILAEGNYPLFYTDKHSGEIVCDPDLMAQNEDTPWGFYYYEVANGSYHRFENHSTGSKYGSSEISAWYKGSGDWLYIADNGSIHPMTNLAPAIMFTAPKDGVYKVDFGCYRPNPNAKLENPIWVRSRFMNADVETQDKESFMFAAEYGSVKNDGQGGKAPISMAYYVNMEQGDKITWELDCYTSGSNGSAGTQLTLLTVCSGITADTPFTLENIAGSDIPLFDAYALGDPEELSDAIAAAQEVCNLYKNYVGTESGKYSQELYDALTAEIANAQQLVESGATQYAMDQEIVVLNAAVQAFLASRMPYEVFFEGAYSIRIADTEKYLTQKNLNTNGTNYYATFTDYNGVVADATKNGMEVSDYNWTFTFKKIENTILCTNDGFVTNDGYVETTLTEETAPAFRFFKYNANDETFAIMNEKGVYWNNSFAWKSPYDMVNTTSEPNYIFVLSETTLAETHDIETAIRQTDGSENKVVSTAWYSASGARLSSPQKGFCIRVQRMSDGSVISKKVVVN